MIKVHHLSNSHSHVVLWLLEELGLDYEIVKHQRDPSTFRSPQSLRDVHPAAKAPTIEDRGCTMIESTGIILYILDAYGDGRLRPPPGTAAAMSFYQWLTYMEGSAKAPLMMVIRVRRLGGAEAQAAMVEEDLKVPFGLIDDALAGREFIAGNAFTAADIQLCFLEELAEGMNRLGPFANMQAHLARMRARDGYRRAEGKGGPLGFRQMFAAFG